MNCPRGCSAQLLMMDRSGIEIDYCPTCRGVWLDRGELDKIIERSASYAADPAAPPIPTSPDAGRYSQQSYAEPQRRRDYDDDDDDRGYDKRKRKKGFLGELFDFD